MKTLLDLFRSAGLLIAAAFLGEPWPIDENGANVHPVSKPRDPLGTMLAYVLLALALLWWALFGWWLDRLKVGHVRQYQDDKGKWHYGKKPVQPK